MSKRNLKRSNIRKQQSERDKLKFADDQAADYGKLATFQHMIGRQDIQYHQYIKIPMELIDLAAAFIAGLISGNDCLVAVPSPVFMTSTLETYQANINFINKTLSRAQITYSSLIVCLWYIDQFFTRKSHINICSNRRCQSRRSSWKVRDLFMASIMVADKYMTDLTWTNKDWAESTHYAYSCQELNHLERRFLDEMDYSLFVSENDYYNFCCFLEFRVHLRQTMIGSRISLSYHNVNVLSQHLNPAYVKRLGLSLRPLDAMILLAKTTTSICIMYAAAIAAALSTAYVCYQYSSWVLTILLEKHLQEHMVLMLVNVLDIPSSLDHTLLTLRH